MVHQMLNNPDFMVPKEDFRPADLQHKINTKESQYDFLVRLDKFLPSINSPLCSTYFLSQAYEETIYVATQENVSPVQRCDLPNKEEVR